MSLLGEIANVLGKEYAEVRADLSNMIVDEFTQQRSDNSPLKTILLCESPHRQETSLGYALAGPTGEKVTAVLRRTPDVVSNMPRIDSQEAIGSLLREQTQHPVLDSLGLMNVSPLPLQKAPYGQHIRQDDGYSTLLLNFEEIRERVQKRKHELDFRTSANWNEASITMLRRVCRVVLADLTRRLRYLPDSALVVPCGHVARNFLRQAESPRRRQWSDPLRAELRSLRHPCYWPRGPRHPLSSSLRKLLSLICTRAV